MFKKFIHRLVSRKHYWRDIGFDELSELYTSMMFRSLAISLVGIFIPIYLYQLDYPIWQILLFYAMVFWFWTVSCYPVARLIAKVGPKHTILASYVFQVISMLMLVSLEDLRWPLISIALMIGLSHGFFHLAFHVDFSKVKHKEHGGKELGWLFNMEKIGAVLGPLIGGLVGYLGGGQYLFMLAIIMLFAGIIPLFITKEPTATNQKLDFKSLKVSDIKHDLISVSSLAIENNLSLVVWPLFVSVYVLSDNPYLKLGSIASISVLISIFVIKVIGQTIDKNKGRTLLRSGVILNAILHLFRPFSGGYVSALGISLANEVLTPIYRMPFFKGMYDAADDWPGRRIVYLTALEAGNGVVKATFFTLLGILTLFNDSKEVFIVIFAAGAILSLGIMLERFKALDLRS